MSKKVTDAIKGSKTKSISKNKKDENIYSNAIISKSICLSFINIGSDLKNTFSKILKEQNEGKCIEEGYVKPNSIKILSYSCGEINGSTVCFNIIFECEICFPVEGMYINCVAKNITKAGIKAEIDTYSEEEKSPLIIFLARDHNYLIKKFSNISINDKIRIRVIGQRFELNDEYISVLGELSNSI